MTGSRLAGIVAGFVAIAAVIMSDFAAGGDMPVWAMVAIGVVTFVVVWSDVRELLEVSE